jgi:hypothetical protein
MRGLGKLHQQDLPLDLSDLHATDCLLQVGCTKELGVMMCHLPFPFPSTHTHSCSLTPTTLCPRRPLVSERAVLDRADGSAKWVQDSTAVLAAVHGPIQAGQRREDAERAVIQVLFKPRNGVPGVCVCGGGGGPGGVDM